MAIANPGKEDYEQYATDELAIYAKDNVCPKVSEELGQELGGVLQSYCKSLIDSARPQIRLLISQQTTQHNYLLFSIYETELALPSPIPSYHFETIGILQNFYTYQAEEI